MDSPTVGAPRRPPGPPPCPPDPLSLEARSERRQLLQFGQRPGRDQDLRAVGQGVTPVDVPHGQTVGVGGHQPHPVPFGGDEHPGEEGSGIVTGRGPHHLAECAGQAAGGEERGRLGWFGQRREVVHREGPQAEPGPGRADLDLVPLGLDGHRSRLERPDDVGQELGRGHTDPVGDPDGLGRGVDGQIEIGADHRQVVPGRLDPDPAQGHGGRTGTDRTACSGEHLHQGVTLASKLHQEVLSRFCFIDLIG